MPPNPPDDDNKNGNDGLSGVRSVAVPPKPEPLRRSNPTIVFNPDDFGEPGMDLPPPKPNLASPPPLPSSSSGPPPLPPSVPPPLPVSKTADAPEPPPPPPIRPRNPELSATLPATPGQPAVPTEQVSQGLVAAISFFVPGGGQVYMGQTVKGLVMLGVACLTLSFCGLFNIFAAYDAYKIAERKNKGETVGDWQFL